MEASDKEPLHGLIDPSKDSSPKTSVLEKSAASCPEAWSKPNAIGKSKLGPSLGKSAGARFTVILLAGKSAPEFFKADLTRSFASSTALSGKPTMVKEGSP